MSLILNIDTAVDTASVCLSENGVIIDMAQQAQKDDGGWLHLTINSLLKKNNTPVNELSAIGVTIGPGSYTGLRVGLSAAKGLCYALSIPLITIGTLEVIAWSVKDEATDLICPMIDARRMEVFSAVYDTSLREIISPKPVLLDAHSFAEVLAENRILFCGNGSNKFQPLMSHINASFSTTTASAATLGKLTHTAFQKNGFADLAYIEPLYLKEFYSQNRR